MLKISPTNQFKKDVKVSQKRNKDFNKFKELIELLVSQIPLPEKYKDHKLKGDYLGNRECHIEPDWLLIYRVENNYLILIRLGSHSDLFTELKKLEKLIGKLKFLSMLKVVF